MIAGLETISAGAIEIGGASSTASSPKTGHRHGVPELRALSAHDGLRQPGFRAEAGEERKGCHPPGRPECRLDARTGRIARSQTRSLSGDNANAWLSDAPWSKSEGVLFDEPLSNLDAKMRVQMRAEIARLHSNLKTTMIYVTHDQVEAMTMGDRICVMREGVLMQVADPLTLYRSRKICLSRIHRQPPMNLLPDALSPATAAGLCGRRRFRRAHR